MLRACSHAQRHGSKNGVVLPHGAFTSPRFRKTRNPNNDTPQGASPTKSNTTPFLLPKQPG